MTKNQQRKIIIDTDPGVDDAIAIFMALAAEELEVIALTAVAGNVPLSTTYPNARGVLAMANRHDVPVYAGCDKPLVRKVVDAAWVHGSDGIGGVKLPPPTAPEQTKHAVDFIIETLKKHGEGEITIASLGPMTNLATALKRAPEAMQKVQEIVIMGAAFREDGGARGNTSAFAEYNIYADPHAADIVFNSGLPITIIPMETGQQVVSRPTEFAKMREIGGTIANAVAAMSENVMNRLKYDGTPLYDPCVSAYLQDSSIFSGRRGNVVTITDEADEKFGMTSLIENSSGNCFVAEKVKPEGFFAVLYRNLEHIKNV